MLAKYFKISIYCLYWLIAKALLQKARNRSVVLMYHSVEQDAKPPSIDPEMFEKQMAYIAGNMIVVPLSEVVEAFQNNLILSAKHVALTFDDGYKDLLTTVLPIIQKYKIPITVFVPSDLTVAADPSFRARLRRSELEELVASPLVHIESHGVSHRRMTNLNLKELQQEMTKSREELKSYTGYQPRYIAYPYGARNQAIEAAAESAGYEAGFSTNDGLVGTSPTSYTLHRVHIDCTMSFMLFRLRLTNAVEVARRIRKWRRMS